MLMQDVELADINVYLCNIKQKPGMIFVRDKGQMCNNLLQYGHLYAWGRENGRRTCSMRFAYKYRYFHICHTPWHHFGTYFMAKTAAKLGLLPVINFDAMDSLEENTIRLSRKRHAVAEGWYVRFYDLFIKYLPEIKDLFAFLPAGQSAVAAQMAGSKGADTVNIGLHVRRGDYARWHGGRYFFSDAQYIGVVGQIAALYPDRRKIVWVCTNDGALDEAAFARTLAAKGIETRFPKGNPGEDLCLLSECDVLAGPPSTFSLVAAMYRDTPLYWISDPAATVTAGSFSRFPILFREIL